MIIAINDEPLFVTRKQGKEILRVAKDKVKLGIYAVKQCGCIELKNESYDTKELLEKAIKEYKAHGFKVYYNGGA
jgi:hypothetical protein